MKKTLIAFIVTAIMSTAAWAGNDKTPPPFEQGGGSATASAGAVAGAAAQAGVHSSISNTVRNDVTSTSSVRNDNANVQGQGQEQAQRQGQDQGQSQNAISGAYSGGNKLTNEGNNAAQRTNVTIQGDMTESNTPPVVAGVLPSVPTSCRLYLFGGGSTRDGAGSGTFPIGNDQTCLSIATLNLMERAGGFTQAEKQKVVCKVEGMADLPTCQAAK